MEPDADCGAGGRACGASWVGVSLGGSTVVSRTVLTSASPLKARRPEEVMRYWNAVVVPHRSTNPRPSSESGFRGGFLGAPSALENPFLSPVLAPISSRVAQSCFSARNCRIRTCMADSEARCRRFGWMLRGPDFEGKDGEKSHGRGGGSSSAVQNNPSTSEAGPQAGMPFLQTKSVGLSVPVAASSFS
jgi:hypothetical protein